MVSSSPAVCLKCKRQDVKLFQARKDSYCHDCFLIFVKSKCRKAIDAFRLELPQNQRNIKMLLALSGGLASAVLVDLVFTSVRRTRGKYEMPTIIYIDDTEYTGQDRQAIRSMLDTLKLRYCDMTFLERPMSDVEHYAIAGAHRTRFPSRSGETSRQTIQSLEECIALLPSKTSQEDMLALYRERLLLETAREHSCEAILFGNSATALAAKTLSLTAKGRGYALPWETADHAMSHTGVWSVRPLKGLMSAEVEIYGRLMGLSTTLCEKVCAGSSRKAGSIDELTQRYFHNLEEQFPSLVATVVRTTNKLVEPVPRDQALGDCEICGMSYQEGARQWLADITVSEPAPVQQGQDENCSDEEAHGTQDPVAENFCYGCVVALRGIKTEVNWPIFKHDTEGVQSRQHGTESLLKEFEIEG